MVHQRTYSEKAMLMKERIKMPFLGRHIVESHVKRVAFDRSCQGLPDTYFVLIITSIISENKRF